MPSSLCPRHRELIYLAFPDDVDYPANRTGSYDQGDPPAELRLIRYHEEHNILIIPAISHTCTCRITKPSGLVRFPPNPTRFNGWSTRSSSGRTGNPYCCTKVGMIVFTRLPLSTKALTFLPSVVRSTSVSGPIQYETGPPTSSSESWICPVTQTFISGHWFIVLGVG